MVLTKKIRPLLIILFVSLSIPGIPLSYGQEEVVLEVEVADPGGKLRPFKETIRISKDELASGRKGVILKEITDESGNKHTLKLSVQNPQEIFNPFYNSQIKNTQIIGKEQWNRFDGENGKQYDLFHLTFPKSDPSDEIRPEVKSQVIFAGGVSGSALGSSPKISVTQNGQNSPAPSTPGEVKDLRSDHLDHLPYIKMIWKDDKVKKPEDLKIVPQKEFNEFFFSMQEKKWEEILQIVGIKNGFESMPVMENIYFSFSRFSTNPNLKKQYPLLTSYGHLYYALLRKTPSEIAALYQQVQDIQSKTGQGELSAKDQDILREAALFVARAAILSRHAGLFYAYDTEIAKTNPHFLEKLQVPSSSSESENAICLAEEGWTLKMKNIENILKSYQEARKFEETQKAIMAQAQQEIIKSREREAQAKRLAELLEREKEAKRAAQEKHDQIVTDFPQATPPSQGLLNGHNYCYMNSTLKIVATFPLLDEALQKGPLPVPGKEKLRKALMHVLADLRNGKVVTKGERDNMFALLLENGWKHESHDKLEQSDPAEFLLFLSGLFNNKANTFSMLEENHKEGKPGKDNKIQIHPGGYINLAMPENAGSNLGLSSLTGALTETEVVRRPEPVSYKVTQTGIEDQSDISLKDLAGTLKTSEDKVFVEKYLYSRYNGQGNYAPTFQYKIKKLAPDQKSLTDDGKPMSESEFALKKGQLEASGLVIIEQGKNYKIPGQDPLFLSNSDVTQLEKTSLDKIREKVKTGRDFNIVKQFSEENLVEMEYNYIKKKSLALKSGDAAPQFLTFSLGRYGNSLGKNKSPVNLEKEITLTFSSADSQDDQKRESYELVGIVDHHGGSLNSGHYTAEVLHPDGWYTHNDSIVKKSGDKGLDLNKGHGIEAYLVIYRKK